MRSILITLSAGGLFVTLFSMIDLDNLEQYEQQIIPAYILKDNTPGFNPLSNEGATLGRVLFYDKNLSLNRTISCSSCHRQELAFSDNAQVSSGFDGGVTGRHSMRLAYSRFSQESHFFWDERAETLEDQTTQPIQDFAEMGFSGTNGQPGLDSLVERLAELPYYQTLFTFVYGDDAITEARIQRALAQFVRSMYSFDSKFDIGLQSTGNLGAPFPNFTQQENQGKTLFLNPPPAGGAGCQGCHRAPEFDIDPLTLNNGVIGVVANAQATDLSNTRAPSLRDLFNPSGTPNGLFMHTGNFTPMQVLNHYNLVPQAPDNTNLDPRLQGPGGNLQLTQPQKGAIIAFLRTLTSVQLYTHPRWSDPFDQDGNLDVVNKVIETAAHPAFEFDVYPNPASDRVLIRTSSAWNQLVIMDQSGRLVHSQRNSPSVDVSGLPAGVYIVGLRNADGAQSSTRKLVVR